MTKTLHKDTAVDFVNRLMSRWPLVICLMLVETEEEFDRAFVPFLESAVQGLETRKKQFAHLNEEALTGVLSEGLRIYGVLDADNEVYSNGRVDIVIRLRHTTPPLKKLCEAKIYDGPEKHFKGIKQLLGYSTGTEAMGFMIAYVKRKNIDELTKRLRAELDEQLPEEQQGPCEDYFRSWSFLTRHHHSSGRIVSLGHVGCNLHVPNGTN